MTTIIGITIYRYSELASVMTKFPSLPVGNSLAKLTTFATPSGLVFACRLTLGVTALVLGVVELSTRKAIEGGTSRSAGIAILLGLYTIVGTLVLLGGAFYLGWQTLGSSGGL